MILCLRQRRGSVVQVRDWLREDPSVHVEHVMDGLYAIIGVGHVAATYVERFGLRLDEHPAATEGLFRDRLQWWTFRVPRADAS